MFVLLHLPFHGFLQESAISESTFPCYGVRAFIADLRSLSQQHSGELGEYGESEDFLFILLPSPSIVRALAPAIKASFHSAGSALNIVERSGSRSPARSLSHGLYLRTRDYSKLINS